MLGPVVSVAVVVLCVIAALYAACASDRSGGRVAPEQVAAFALDVAAAAVPELAPAPVAAYAYHRELLQEMHTPTLLPAATESPVTVTFDNTQRTRDTRGHGRDAVSARFGSIGPRSGPLMA